MLNQSLDKTIYSSHPQLLIAHPGARRHYLEAHLFQEWGILHRFYTDFYAGNHLLSRLLRQPNLLKILPKILQKGLDRFDSQIQDNKVTHFPFFAYQFLHKLRDTPQENHPSVYIWAGQEFCKKIIQHGLGKANTIYSFNGFSLELFKHAKSQGLHCILDQAQTELLLMYKILLEESKSWPNWSKDKIEINDKVFEWAIREKEEQELADTIICGSEFVKQSLTNQGIDASKIIVCPLGRTIEMNTDKHVLKREIPSKRGDGLRILFAGEVGLRKGIPYLLDALKSLKGVIPFTCQAAGTLAIQFKYLDEYSDVCNFLGAVPRSNMTQLYEWADIFVLPSLCEGSAMVTHEALAKGLPVITTFNAGSLVRDGIDGVIVSPRDSQGIAQALLNFYNDQYSFNPNTTLQYLEQRYRNFLTLCKDKCFNL
jgi:glycosyltransferase involved in cell wall biosynthesis